VSLAVIQARTLLVFHVLVYKYAALRFTTRSSVGAKIASLVTLIACRRLSTVRSWHRSS
jgi:hypothetical protein